MRVAERVRASSPRCTSSSAACASAAASSSSSSQPGTAGAAFSAARGLATTCRLSWSGTCRSASALRSSTTSSWS
eukprot:626782-Prymnesium_polylepis.1